jgi:hypothetical protein
MIYLLPAVELPKPLCKLPDLAEEGAPAVRAARRGNGTGPAGTAEHNSVGNTWPRPPLPGVPGRGAHAALDGRFRDDSADGAGDSSDAGDDSADWAERGRVGDMDTRLTTSIDSARCLTPTGAIKP